MSEDKVKSQIAAIASLSEPPPEPHWTPPGDNRFGPAQLPSKLELRCMSARDIAGWCCALHADNAEFCGAAARDVNRFLSEAAIELSYKVLNALV